MKTNPKRSLYHNFKFNLFTWFEAIIIMLGLNEFRKAFLSGDNNHIITGIGIIIIGVGIFGVKRHFH